MKKISIIVSFLFLCNCLNAQTATHTIKKGETIAAIAKKYNVSSKEVLILNGLSDNTILNIGQVIKLPKNIKPSKFNESKGDIKNLSKEKDNSVQKNNITLNDNQYLIEKGDNLGKIAQKFSVTKQELMEWNGLINDNIKAGSYIVVSKKNINKAKQIDAKTKLDESKITPATQNKEIANKAEPKKEITVEKPITAKETKETPVLVEPNEPKDEKNQKNSDIKTVKSSSSPKSTFESEYVSSNNTIEGLCGIFKTIAGWHDKKYYILVNNAQAGTVVKVMANNKFVYAKVLGPLPDLKDDKNLSMRVSNATASALGIQENKFNAKIEF